MSLQMDVDYAWRLGLIDVSTRRDGEFQGGSVLETGAWLLEIYRRLLEEFGPQGWWPAEGDFEMVVGAILTQSTAWVNVEKAIANLRGEGLLAPDVVAGVPEARLAQLITPSGYFRQKARKVKAFVEHLENGHGGDLDALFHVKLPELRETLLGIWGIGPETADSIILYGARQPIFVVDAYTRRIFGRLGLTPADASYDVLQRLFMDHLPASVSLFQEYHALLVALGKEICRPTPLCSRCPLREICPSALQSARAVTTKDVSPAPVHGTRGSLVDCIAPSQDAREVGEPDTPIYTRGLSEEVLRELVVAEDAALPPTEDAGGASGVPAPRAPGNAQPQSENLSLG